MVTSREDRMLIKVSHQEKGYGSKAEFLNKAFELTDNVFSVNLVPKDKKISTQETQFIENLHTVPK